MTVNIDSVVYKTYDKTKVTLYGTSFTLDGQSVTLKALDDDVALTKQADGSYVNINAITLTLQTGGSNFTGGKTASVAFVGASYDGSLNTAETSDSANTVTITIAAGKLTIDPAQAIQLVLTENT